MSLVAQISGIGGPYNEGGEGHQVQRVEEDVEKEELFDSQPLEVEVGLSHGGSEEVLLVELQEA